MSEIDDAYDAYHQDYERRKNEVCTRLLTVCNKCSNDTYSKWILDAIKFIREEHR